MIDNLIKEALKEKKTVELKVYRNLKAEILKVKTQKNAPEITDDTLLKIYQKYAKNLEDSILEFSKAGREDLVSECREELEVVKKLLPEPVDASEIYFEVGRWSHKNGCFITGVNAKIIPQIPKKEMGNVIKHIKSKFPTAEGKMISEIVKEYLV